MLKLFEELENFRLQEILNEQDDGYYKKTLEKEKTVKFWLDIPS